MTKSQRISALSQVATAVGGALEGEDLSFDGVSSDSRTIRPGELFVALTGPRFDGADYLQMALDRGAVGAIVSESSTPEVSADQMPQIRVSDPLQALSQLAAAWRKQFDIPLVAITGSNGKTTVKEMTASILRQIGPGVMTAGNLNNEIGVPLTLLRIRPNDQWAVIEMGASAVGEIAALMALTEPTISLANNAGTAHLGGFGSSQQVVEAKGEIYRELPMGGVAVINHALPPFQQWCEMAQGNRIETFSDQGEKGSLLHGESSLDQPFRIEFDHLSVQPLEVNLPLPGAHNRSNALAAAALTLQVGATPAQIGKGLESVVPVSGRLSERRGRAGTVVIDDSYNASPESVKCAIEVLAAQPGRGILVLGDMGELGENAEQLHREVGAFAKASGVQQLLALGELSFGAVEEFGKGGQHFDSLESLLKALEPQLDGNTTVLVKGSRFMRMERVVEQITETMEAHDPS